MFNVCAVSYMTWGKGYVSFCWSRTLKADPAPSGWVRKWSAGVSLMNGRRKSRWLVSEMVFRFSVFPQLMRSVKFTSAVMSCRPGLR